MANNFDAPEMTELQSAKYATYNDGIKRIVDRLTEMLTVDLTSANATVTDLQSKTYIAFYADNATVAGRTITFPANKGFFIVVADSSNTEDVSVEVGATAVAVASGQAVLFYADGTTDGLYSIAGGTGGGGGSSGGYDLRLAFSDTPTTDEVIDTIPIVRELTFPANFAGSLGIVGTNPTSSFELSVQDDAVEIGTITIGTDGSFTFATDSGAEQIVASGSFLTVVAPTSVDATVANVSITMLGAY